SRYKRWTKNAKNNFINTEILVNDNVERVLKFRVGALASNCNKLCDIAYKDLADVDEVQSELVKLIIRLQSRKQGKSTPNSNVEGISDPFVVKCKGAPSKRSSWRKKRACYNCYKYGHYYKHFPDLRQHSEQGNPCKRSDGNASAKVDFSQQRFTNSSRSISVKFKDLSRPKTKRGSWKFMAMGLRSRKGNDNTFDKVKDSHQEQGHLFTNYECDNHVMDETCDTPQERELLINSRYRELVLTKYDIEHGIRNLLVRRESQIPRTPHPITVRFTLKYFEGMFLV
ncbi:hypothetical protein HN51_021501, partial [Arachis hypogaea]